MGNWAIGHDGLKAGQLAGSFLGHYLHGKEALDSGDLGEGHGLRLLPTPLKRPLIDYATFELKTILRLSNPRIETQVLIRIRRVTSECSV
jgi:hypothetical protein